MQRSLAGRRRIEQHRRRESRESHQRWQEVSETAADPRLNCSREAVNHPLGSWEVTNNRAREISVAARNLILGSLNENEMQKFSLTRLADNLSDFEQRRKFELLQSK